MGKITFYDGVKEIGGTKILLEISKKKFFLDFGMNYKKRNFFFEEFLNPRVANGIGDLFFLGLIPKIKGLYRKDLVKMLYSDDIDELGSGEEPNFVDGIFLSHAHFDHSGYISFLREEIPIYTSKITEEILRAMEEVSVTKFETSIFKFIRRPAIGSWKSPEFYGEHKAVTLKEKMQFDNVTVFSYPVDHSVPGANGFVFTGNDGSVVYTGDLRLHGKNKKDTENFILSASQFYPDILIIEGTNLRGEETKREFWTEEKVYQRAGEVMQNVKGLIFADFSIRDVNRFMTFYTLSKAINRKFVITLKDAYLIHAMHVAGMDVPDITDSNIFVYKKKRKTGTYIEKDYSERWIKEILKLKPKTVIAKDIRKNESAFVFVMRYWDLQELVDLRPSKGSKYIHSSSEAHTEEQEIDEWRMDNWLKLFNLYPKEHIHASGHAKKEDLFKIVDTINPKIIIPVHTEHPEEYVKKFGNKVKIVNEGSTFQF
jgi:ribonuclease J